MKTITAIFFLALIVATGAAQQQRTEGRITYISGDMVYTSLGKNSGIRDSSLIYVMNQNDTSGILVVIAASSSSSACRSLSGVMKFRINDRVVSFLTGAEKEKPSESGPVAQSDSLRRDSIAAPKPAADLVPENSVATETFSLHGAIGLQYYGAVYSTVGQNSTQPAISIALRGTSNNSPFSFQLRGLLRTNVRGTLNPFARSSINRSRLHRLSLDYDDGLYKFSIGRVPPSPFPGLGYVDGLYGSFKKGLISGGIAAGFEPGYGQELFSSARRKAAMFFGISSPDHSSYALTLGYSRTYVFAALDRETGGAILTAQPARELSLYAQAEVDLRTTTNRQIRFAPRFTSLYGNVNYRLMQQLSLGAGVTSWRPLYSLQTSLVLADSLIDRELRTNPYVSANVYLPERIMIFGQYSPRTSTGGFGKEYLLNAGCSAIDLLQSGFSLRTTLFRNVSGLNQTDGLTVSLQRSFMGYADITARGQIYGTNQNAMNDPVTSRTFGLDVSFALMDHLSLWGSLERTIDSYVSSTFFLTELSWRF